MEITVLHLPSSYNPDGDYPTTPHYLFTPDGDNPTTPPLLIYPTG